MCAHMEVGCEEHAALQAHAGDDVLHLVPVQAVWQNGDGRLVHGAPVPAHRAPGALCRAAARPPLLVYTVLLHMRSHVVMELPSDCLTYGNIPPLFLQKDGVHGKISKICCDIGPFQTVPLLRHAS
jgi:hypothetical protein